MPLGRVVRSGCRGQLQVCPSSDRNQRRIAAQVIFRQPVLQREWSARRRAVIAAAIVPPARNETLLRCAARRVKQQLLSPAASVLSAVQRFHAPAAVPPKLSRNREPSRPLPLLLPKKGASPSVRPWPTVTFVKSVRREFRGNTTTLTVGGKPLMKSRFLINSARGTIGYLDLRQEGIYKVSGDTLLTCLVVAGETRPADFSAAPGDGRTVSEWSRTKPARK